MKYYYYHLITSPELSFVAVNENNQVVGYVLGKVYFYSFNRIII